MINDANIGHHIYSLNGSEQWPALRNNNGEKYCLTDNYVLDKFKPISLTRIESKPMYSYLQVWNEEIWGDVVAVLSLIGQGNGLLGDYTTPTLYTTIYTNPYLTPHNPGTNATYPPGATMVARDNIKDNWKRDIIKYATRNIYQNTAEKMLI